MPIEASPTTESEFYDYWGRVIATGLRLSAAQFELLLSSANWPEALDQALSQLAARMLITPQQTDRALEWVSCAGRGFPDAKRDLRALSALFDAHAGPLYKLQVALSLRADWQQ